MTSERLIGVAIAGLGFGETVHLPALHATPGLNPVALWHPRRDRVDQACREHGLKGTDDWNALLADPAVEAIVIATPPAPRFDLARQALEAGRHLLLEKPVALQADQVQELQRLAQPRPHRLHRVVEGRGKGSGESVVSSRQVELAQCAPRRLHQPRPRRRARAGAAVCACADAAEVGAPSWLSSLSSACVEWCSTSGSALLLASR